MALRQHGSATVTKGSRRYDRWWWGTWRLRLERLSLLSAHALHLTDPIRNNNATDVTAGNESVITWAAPRVMNHGSGGMRLDGSRWLWCLRLASPNNNAQLHKEGEEERGNKGGKRWRRGWWSEVDNTMASAMARSKILVAGFLTKSTAYINTCTRIHG